MDFLRSLGHPEEIYNLLKFKLGGFTLVIPKQEWDSMRDSLKTCYKHLHQTSRSYAPVVNALEGQLRDAVCILYLALRSLDAFEDDMTLSPETKTPMLLNLHKYMYQEGWRFTESNDKHRQVLQDFSTISLEFRNLPVAYQKVIADTTRVVGIGMAEFLEKEVESVQDYLKYSHYATGIWMIAKSQLFCAAGLEDSIIAEDVRLSGSVGLLYQKLNGCRDFLEDQQDGIDNWPREVWGKYVKKLSDFTKPENIVPAVQCLNEMVTDALEHVPDLLLYLSRLRSQTVIRLKSIQLVMAMATLSIVYNNQQVFKGVVKIRKGQALTHLMGVTNAQEARSLTYKYANEIYQKIPPTDPSAEHTRKIVSTIQEKCLSSGPLVPGYRFTPINLSCAVVLAALSWQYLGKS